MSKQASKGEQCPTVRSKCLSSSSCLMTRIDTGKIPSSNCAAYTH